MHISGFVKFHLLVLPGAARLQECVPLHAAALDLIWVAAEDPQKLKTAVELFMGFLRVRTRKFYRRYPEVLVAAQVLCVEPSPLCQWFGRHKTRTTLDAAFEPGGWGAALAETFNSPPATD